MLANGRSITTYVVLVAMLLAISAAAQGEIVLSTKANAKVGDLRFRDGDLIRYDMDTGIASLLFDEDLFRRNEDIDAVYAFESGTLVLSTKSGAKLGGLRFRDGDLVEYDPVSDIATLFFSEDLFTRGNADVNALHILANGHLILSTRAKATLGGLSFRDGDLVEYDPVSDTATLFFSEDLFRRNEDIDAVFVLDDGHIVLSTRSRATLGGLRFENGDLIEYDPVCETASIYFDESVFTHNEDINAASGLGEYIEPPEPATFSLLAIGGILILLKRRRRANTR